MMRENLVQNITGSNGGKRIRNTIVIVNGAPIGVPDGVEGEYAQGYDKGNAPFSQPAFSQSHE